MLTTLGIAVLVMRATKREPAEFVGVLRRAAKQLFAEGEYESAEELSNLAEQLSQSTSYTS